ncbi:hypothetical protein AWB69_08118 [Caballeronia udeis]|uniref:Uncharacterized protein n=1 Tax=Caballeronia udeis TaxID=1232866 RepID=A0A158JKH0_9BURK|nr:hypothetical protein AWB69_08118 [Caballeronia udeis]
MPSMVGSRPTGLSDPAELLDIIIILSSSSERGQHDSPLICFVGYDTYSSRDNR